MARPSIDVTAAELESGIGVLSAFVKAGLVGSTSEARRQIKAGGLKVNNATVASDTALLTPSDVEAGVVKLSLGRKKHVLLRPK